jgi:dTDP-4-dehydrorhamnose 3,5-epimerase
VRRNPPVTVPSHPDAKTRINDKARQAYFVQDYAARPGIDGVQIVELKRFNDDGGSITELGRIAAGMHGQLPGFEVKQVNYSEMEPGAIKAFHMHHRQTDVWYVPPGDKLLLVLHDCRAGSASEGRTMRFVLGDGKDRLVRIPPGVAHGARNIDCDEGRLPWDYLGADIWEIVRG